MKRFYAELAEAIRKEKPADATNLKIRLSRKYGMEKIPSNIEVFLNSSEKELKWLKLVTKPTRTLSGVATISIMTAPARCPHGKCTFCPGGIGSAFGNVPQSYTGKEPATMRAVRSNFDAYIQVFSRLEQYAVLGQAFDKVELIIQGGTFPSLDKAYQSSFVADACKAMNDFSKEFFAGDKLNLGKFKEFFELPGNYRDEERLRSVKKKILQLKNKAKSSLEAEQKRNEKAKIKCVGLTVETKPDWGFLEQGNQMLKLGCTRVELGVQSVYDLPLKLTNRGHTLSDTIKSMRILKDLGFKINAHYMLGLPGVEMSETATRNLIASARSKRAVSESQKPSVSDDAQKLTLLTHAQNTPRALARGGFDREKEIEGLRQLFSNPDFKPDMLKIYPLLVIEGTPLYLQWKRGQYKPVTTAEAAEIIAEAKRFFPKWVRIMRINRDIPSYLASAGIDRTNLRQYVKELQQKKGIACNCIRCREIGRNKKFGKAEITVTEYEASEGKELFIAAEYLKNNVLLGFCRLRFPSQQLRKEITKDAAIVRELHVYAAAVEVGKKADERQVQHRGYGKMLLKKAEEIARKRGKKKMIVLSGIGAKEYYKKLGYIYDGVYMVKKL